MPRLSGEIETFIISNLLPNRNYNFAIKTKDRAGNLSNISNSPGGTTKKQSVLTITKNGNGHVSPAIGSYNYSENEVTHITANPDAGWVFSHWSGDASGTAGQIDIAMTGNKSITANFGLQGVTLIAAIKQNPTAFVGQTVKVSGAYRGWESGYGSPPVTRSDFVVLDETGSIYVTGTSSLRYPDDLGKSVQITGLVRIKDGQPYLEVPRSR